MFWDFVKKTKAPEFARIILSMQLLSQITNLNLGGLIKIPPEINIVNYIWLVESLNLNCLYKKKKMDDCIL